MTDPYMRPPIPERIKLPPTRLSLTHRREACGFKLYVTVTFFDDGRNPNLSEVTSPCEVFCKIAKQGSVVSGLMDGVCGPVSIALQHGIPWEIVSKPLRHHTFETKGDPDHTSILDALVKCVDHLIEEQRKRIIGEEPGKQD